MRFALAAAITLTSAVAMANDAVKASTIHTLNALDNVALNASAATRTVTATFQEGATRVSPYTKWRVSVFYTYSAATTVTAVFSCSIDGTRYASLTSRSITGGASAVAVVTDTYTTSAASADIMLEFDIQGCRKAKLVLGGASAAAGDLVDVDWAAVAGG